MSIRGGFDRLTKELDALTYNSRSVLNALIRSTVASGTSQGYVVTRAGVELTLSRVDIYRVYQFYQAWQVNGFATVPVNASSTGGRVFSFDEIRLEQDKTPVTFEDGTQNLSATTDALVIHSQILFLNSNTLASEPSNIITNQAVVDNSAVTSYWLDFIKEFNDPKLLSNSSPIPVNLRTPVFDENMGTDVYSNHPTYLFPYQYFGLQLLGYPGDDTNHFGGGNSWTWQLDQYISFETPAFSSGGVNSQSEYKTVAERNYILDPDTGRPFQETYSTVWGFDTHARSLGSTAGGTSSMVPRYANHSTAIGFNNLASGIQSTSIGGINNIAASQNSGVFSGKSNVTAGGASFATNSSNITGGSTFSFTLPQSNTSIECIVDTSDLNCAPTETGTQFGANVIAIEGNVVGELNEQDSVVIYAYTTFIAGSNSSGNTYSSVDGDTFESVSSLIQSIYYDNISTSLNNGKTVITLEDDIPNPARIDGGSITQTRARFGARKTLISLGNSSSVFGEGNYASGVRQTVVGSFNRPAVVDTTLRKSGAENFRYNRFVVGGGVGSSNRNNTLEVYDGRFVVYGNGQSLSEMPLTPRQFEFSQFIGFDVDDEAIRMMYNSNRIELDGDGFLLEKYTGSAGSMFIRSTDDDTIEITNWQKSIQLQTGVGTTLATGGTNTLSGRDIGIISDSGVVISALADMIIMGNNSLSLRSNVNAYISWDASLIFDGNTYGALPTTDTQYAHEYGTGTEVLDFNNSYLGHSGFYSLNSNLGITNSPIENYDAVTDWLLMTTSVEPQGSDVAGNSMQFTVGRPFAPTRPFVRTGITNGTYTPWVELATMNDVNPIIEEWRDAFSDDILTTQFTYYVTDSNYYTKSGASSFVQAHYKIVGTTYFIKIIVDTISIFSEPAALVGDEEAVMIELCVNDSLNIIQQGVSTGVTAANLTNLVVANPYTNVGSTFNETYSTGIPHNGSAIRFRRFDGNGSLAPWSNATDGTVKSFMNTNITPNTNTIKLSENKSSGFNVDDIVTFNVISGTVPAGLTDATQYQILTSTSEGVWRDAFFSSPSIYSGEWVTKYYVTLSDLNGTPVDITDVSQTGTYEIVKSESTNPANEVVTYEFVMEMTNV